MAKIQARLLSHRLLAPFDLCGFLMFSPHVGLIGAAMIPVARIGCLKIVVVAYVPNE